MMTGGLHGQFGNLERGQQGGAPRPRKLEERLRPDNDTYKSKSNNKEIEAISNIQTQQSLEIWM
jgi:hypothetical protein